MSFVKKPCKHCPFRHDVKPFLTAARGEEIAFHALNPYNSFPCHKTTQHEEDEEGESYMAITEESLECAGFLTIRAIELGEDHIPEGFIPSPELIYDGVYEMAEAYQIAEQDE